MSILNAITSGAGGVALSGDTSGNLVIQSAGANVASFTTGGNLLVGTTSLNGIDGITLSPGVSSSTQPDILINTSVTGSLVYFRYNSITRGTISTDGTSTTYGTTSDYRLKENVAPMVGALATVSALKPVTYKWKTDGSNGQGFIAHELQEIVPDCVTGTKDGLDKENNPEYQCIDTSFLVATLTAAIQELNAKVDAQAAEIAALKGA